MSCDEGTVWRSTVNKKTKRSQTEERLKNKQHFNRSKHNERATKLYQKEQKEKSQHKLKGGRTETTTNRPTQLFMLLPKSETRKTPLGLSFLSGSHTLESREKRSKQRTNYNLTMDLN